jgi:hypothetical protein
MLGDQKSVEEAYQAEKIFLQKNSENSVANSLIKLYEARYYSAI